MAELSAGPADVPSAEGGSTSSLSGQTAGTLVSVVVSTYAGERLLAGCLEMLLAQTVAANTEIIVIDSGSPEDERAIAEDFQRTHANVRYVRTERETIYAAWNRGLGLASGTYFVNVNVDDWIRHDALECFARALDRHPEASLAYAPWATTHQPQQPPAPDDVVSFHPAYEPALTLFYCYGGCTQFWRRSSLVELGGFDSSFMACGDLDVLIRLAERGGTAALVPEVLAGFFHNPGGLSHSTDTALHEQYALFAAARANMPLHRLYAIDPIDPAAVADAWVALGNLAVDVRVPWHDRSLGDTYFALICYDRALAMSPDHPDALHNRFAVLVTSGRHAEAEYTLDRLTPDEAAHVRGVDLALRRPAVEPAVRGPVFAEASGTAASGALRLKGTAVLGPDPVAVELETAKEYIASLEHHLAAANIEIAGLSSLVASLESRRRWGRPR